MIETLASLAEKATRRITGWTNTITVPRPQVASIVMQHVVPTAGAEAFDWGTVALGPTRATLVAGDAPADSVAVTVRGRQAGFLPKNLALLVHDSIAELSERGRVVQLEVWNFGDGSAPRLMTPSPSGIAKFLFQQL